MSEIQSAFTECLAWWGLTFFLGIAFREFSRDEVGRWLGRISVATSCFVLISFCEFAIHQCNVQYQVIVSRSSEGIIHAKREDKSTSEISEVIREIRTPAGHIVTVKFNSDSWSGTTANSERSMSRRADSGDRGVGEYRQADRSFGRGFTDGSGTRGHIGRMPFTQPSLSEWK